eukprot:TRINITY_DN6203_c0_g1_i3.p2 TRINITY_DN6203_c0_g1~~TRINITY_DN6203_c0_g1_i3.p2  ORF type:complete len:506 (-),score=51.34 TRINITY_DN6203_c0_g1_i3:426-1889(-)
MLAKLLLFLLAPLASGYCEVCHLQNDHTKDYSTPFEADAFFYDYCRQYKDNACCSFDTVNNLVSLYPGYEFNRCDSDPALPRKMSDECFKYFVDELCFYECDVNAGKYRAHPTCEENSWEMVGMPIKASYCNAWFDACKDDFICACRPEDNCSAPKSSFALPQINCTYDNGEGTCQTLSEVYADGKELCEVMFDGAFIYYEDEENAYTMSFEEGEPNPNNDIHPQVPFPPQCPGREFEFELPEACEGLNVTTEIVPHTCEVCVIRNDHTLDVAKPVSGDLQGCQKYAQYSCCSEEIAGIISDPYNAIYGEEWSWSRCYDDKTVIPEKCARWFVDEECFYECDVNAGKYRLHEECEVNGWQISAVPLGASECDQWYEDCKDVALCVCTGDDCPEGATPYSLFSQTYWDCTEDQCQTIGSLYADGEELCNKLYEGSFFYETHEKAAYSLAWDQELLFNPNNFVNTHIEFPNTCPGHNATKDDCNVPDIN